MAEWTQDNLQPLIDRYNEYLVSVGKSYAITLNGQAPTIKGFLSQGAIVLATDVWLKLREFGEWVVDEYDVTDNQSGVGLGVASAPYAVPNGVWGSDSLRDNTSIGLYGLSSGTYSVYVFYEGSSISSPVLAFVDGKTVWVCSRSYFSSYRYYYYNANNVLTQIQGIGVTTYSYSGTTMYGSYYNLTPIGGTWSPDYSVLPNLSLADVGATSDAQRLYNILYDGAGENFSGVTADTTTVSVPAALPEGTSWGGLAVEGVGDVATPQAVEDAIAEAVTAREQPVVQPVTITLAPDTEINPDNGDTDPPPVVITPFPPADPSAVELGQEILESFEAHFPFSVPWDLYKIFSRLDAEPVAPSWTLALPEVGGLEPVSIVIDVAETPFHSLAPTFRAFVGIVICLGLLIAATKWIKR